MSLIKNWNIANWLTSLSYYLPEDLPGSQRPQKQLHFFFHSNQYTHIQAIGNCLESLPFQVPFTFFICVLASDSHKAQVLNKNQKHIHKKDTVVYFNVEKERS